MKLIVTVDTEADNQWAYDGRIFLENLQCLPRFQALCEKHEFVPTYLLACEVLEDKTFVVRLNQWRRSGRAEVGAHLQPWTTPPYMAEEERDRAMQSFPSELPASWFARKLSNLTERIGDATGESPRSFRAARWGLNGSMVRTLAENGYIVDCSVTPKISWKGQRGMSGGTGGPDYRRAVLRPFELSTEDVCCPGRSGLLEVPVTVIYTGSLIRERGCLSKGFARLPEGPVKEVLDRLVFGRKWLRISRESRTGDWEKIHDAAVRNGLDVLEFMIHSSELMAGGSPLSRNADDVEFIYARLEEMFCCLKARGVTGCTLSQYASNPMKRVAGAV
jgi:hypothetical protein